MKHIKHTAARTFAGFLAAVLSAGMLAVSSGAVFAEESTTQSNTFDDGTLTYTITDGTNVSVTGCATSATHVSIMPEIDGYCYCAVFTCLSNDFSLFFVVLCVEDIVRNVLFLEEF